MAKADDLIANYEKYARLPWQAGISGAERIWFAVYEARDERRMRCRLGEFDNATQRAGHAWSQIDLKDAFAEWMAAQDYRDAYFASPPDLSPMMSEFRAWVAARLI